MSQLLYDKKITFWMGEFGWLEIFIGALSLSLFSSLFF